MKIALAIVGALILGMAQTPAPIRLPIERASEVFFVRASLNGVGPLWFTVDTGATLTVIDPDTAARAGLSLRAAGSRPNVGTAAGDTSLATVTGATIRIDGMPPYTPPSLYVVAVKANAGILGHQIDGVLGTDVLKRYVAEFRYGTGEVVLHAPTLTRPPGGAAPVPITVDRNMLVAPSGVTLPDGAKLEARLLVDTGSSGALTLTTPFVRQHRLSERFPSLTLSAAVGINGMTMSPVIEIPAFTFGSATFPVANVSLSRATSGVYASTEFDGILGAAILRRFSSVVIDYPRLQLHLTK